MLIWLLLSRDTLTEIKIESLLSLHVRKYVSMWNIHTYKFKASEITYM